MGHEPTRRRFEPPDVAAFHSLVATALNIFVFSFVLISAVQSRPNTGGVIDDQTAAALLGLAIIVLICIPLFLISVGLAIYGSYKQHDPWGLASLVLNFLLVGGLFLFAFMAKALDTPERRAAQERQARQRWAQRQAPRQLGGIDISTDSTLYKAATSPWLPISCFSLLALATVICARKRGFNFSLRKTVANPEPPGTDSPLNAKCPNCHAEIGRVLLSGGVTCPACSNQFLFSNPTSQKSKRSFAAGLLTEGSSAKRISATVCVIGLVLFGLMWIWFAALGNTQMANRMLAMLLVLSLAFAGVFANHSLSDRSG